VVDDAEHALDGQRDGPRDEQRQLLALVGAQRPDEHELQRDAEREAERRDDEDPDEGIDVQLREEAVAEVGAEDDQRALRDVDDLHHAEGQRQAAGHQRVDAAREQAQQGGLDEQVHRLRGLPTRGETGR
jgi:hypothetical protein